MWDLEIGHSVCPHCSVGCNVHPGARHRELQRVRVRENPAVNGVFLCDRGQFGHGYVNDPRRPLAVRSQGEPATWEQALRKWGTRSLSRTLKPAEQLARKGFVVDQTFQQQVANNQARFAAFPSTRSLYLPGGAPPAPGTVFRNPDLADTYAQLERQGTAALYRGPIGADLVKTVQHPPVDPASTLNVRAGKLAASDLAAYRAIERDPTHARYEGLDVYGMPAPSSGGLIRLTSAAWCRPRSHRGRCSPDRCRRPECRTRLDGCPHCRRCSRPCSA